MSRSLFRLLGLVAAALAATLAVELTHGALSLTRAIAVVSDPPMSSAAGIAVPDRPSEWLQRALLRPLFRPDRRPLPSATVAAGTILPRLTGIVISPSGSEAIFSSGAGGQPIVTGVGGTVASWTVTRISPVEVTIERARLVQVLHPVFDDTPGSPRADSTTGDAGRPSSYSSTAELPAITRLLRPNPQ